MNQVVSLFIHLLVCCDYLRRNRANKIQEGTVQMNWLRIVKEVGG